MKKLKRRKALLGAMVLGLIFTCLGIFSTWKGITHHGNGVWTYGGEEPGTGGNVVTKETEEIISEKQYRKESYAAAIPFFILGVIFLGNSITTWKERDKLEAYWKTLVSDPEKIEDIHKNAKFYRDDFKQWIKEN